MKKILTTILVFLGFLTLGVTLSANASSSIVTFDFYNEAKLASTNGTDVTKEYLNSNNDYADSNNFVTEFSNNSTTVQYDKNGGLTLGAAKKTGKMTITLAKKIEKVEIIGTIYDSGSKFKVNGVEGTGDLGAKASKLEDVTVSLVWNFSSSVDSISIETTSKRLTIYKLILTLETEKPTTPAVAENFISHTTKASLNVSYDANLEPTNVDLRFGNKIDAAAFDANAKYGVLVVAGNKSIKAGATEFATADEFANASDNTGFKFLDCTPNVARVNENGVLAEDGDFYQFAWVITDMEGHYSDTLTAVMYMEYDGVLYLCDAKITSVVAVAKEYYVSYENGNEYGLTDDQALVLFALYM